MFMLSLNKMGMGPEGGCNRPFHEFRNLCIHTGLVRTNIASLLEPAVDCLPSGRSHAHFAERKQEFGESQAGDSNPWHGARQDARHGIQNALSTNLARLVRIWLQHSCEVSTEQGNSGLQLLSKELDSGD